MPLPKEHLHTIEDIYNLPDGQRAELIDGVIYDMAPPGRIHQKKGAEDSAQYFFSDTVKSCIFADLEICIENLLK